jgi:pyruvate dehydrogenase E2 component (dihydrolipoamide acetyltransferase)
METARVLRWLKAVDDTVALGEPLVEVETEKATVEIEASVSGRLVEILARPDDEVAVGAAIAWVEDGQPETAKAEAVSFAAPSERSASLPAAAPSARREASPRASPAARRLAAELDVDLAHVEGSGPGGRIQLEDVERAASARKTPPRAVAPQPAHPPLSPMRRAVARTMALSNATVPQFNVSRAVDWTEVQAVRAELAPRAAAAGVKLSLNDFLAQAVARALLEFSALNGIFVGDPESPHAHIQAASGVHIGLVVALDDGMLVPVLHGVERLSLVQLARARSDLVERARAGRLRQEEASGATFTISNLGAQGPDRFTALLNPPESAILAVGRTVDRPCVRHGAVVVRPVSELTLTLDHRLADGRAAAMFLARLVQILEGRAWHKE